MSTNADNPNGPAQSDAVDYKALYEKEAKEKADLRRAYNQRDQEIRAAREAANRAANQPVDYGYQEEEPQQVPRGGNINKYGDQDIEAIHFRQARNEFLLMNPEGREYWDRINQVFADESRLSNFAAWDGNGRPNFERAIRDIYRDIRWQEMEAAKAKAAATNPTPAAPVRPASPSPLISGGSAPMPSASGLGDPNEMTPEQLFEVLQSDPSVNDPHDPIRGASIGNPGDTSLR